MDACDPGTESGNIRRLIKLHTGETIKLSKAKVCEIMKAAKENRSPLPPLGLTKDKKYLLDAKSPLTQRDFEILFKSTSKLTEIKRIAKKSGLIQLDKTINELKSAIGRRLRSMNVREPVLLHGRAATQRVSSDNKFYNLENNINTTRNANNDNNNNGERTNINSARVNKNINSARENSNKNTNTNTNRNGNRNGNRKPNVNITPRTNQSTGNLSRDLARLRHQRRLQSTGGFGLGGGRVLANGMGGRRMVANGMGGRRIFANGGSSFLRGASSNNRTTFITRNTSRGDAAIAQLATERREMARRMNLARQEAERLANRAAQNKTESARSEARLARNRFEQLQKNMNEKERETRNQIRKLENEKRNTERKLNNASEKINNISAAKNNATSKLNTATKKKNLLEVKYRAARNQINEEKRLAAEAVQAAKAAQLSNNQAAINEATRAKNRANAKVVELEQQFTTMRQQLNNSKREVTSLQQKANNATTKLNTAQKSKNLLEVKYKAAREQMEANQKKINASAANLNKLQKNLNESKKNVNTKIMAAAREAGNQARQEAEAQAQQNIQRIQNAAANEKRTLENNIAAAKREANELRNSTNAKIANAKREAEAAGREAQKANNAEEMRKANNAKRNANAKVAALEQEAKNKRRRMLEKLLNQYKVTNRQPYINRFNSGERISVIAEEFKKQEANKIQQNKNNALREQREKNAEVVKQKEKAIRLNTLKKLRTQGLLVVHPNKGGSKELFVQFNGILKKAETNGNVSSNDLKTLQNLINQARNKKISNARTKLTEAQAKANTNARAAEQRLANQKAAANEQLAKEKANAEQRLANQKAAANKEMAARRIQNAFRAKQAAAKAEANAKAKANAEAKAKANAEAKAKANAEAKAKANAEAKVAANKAAKLATLLNSYKNLTNDEKVRFTRNAQTKNLESIKKNIIELLRKKAANRKEQANKAAKNKANANRQRAFNKLLQEFSTATNNDKTEARSKFGRGANVSAIRAFLNIRTRTRKEAEEKKKQANKAEAEKRAEKKRKFLEGKKKELTELATKGGVLNTESDFSKQKFRVVIGKLTVKNLEKEYNNGNEVAEPFVNQVKNDIMEKIAAKKQEPIYTNTGSPGPRIKMQTNPIATDRKNPLFEKVTMENKSRLISAINALKQLPPKNKTIFKGRLETAFKNQNLNKMKAIKNEALAANKAIQNKKAAEKQAKLSANNTKIKSLRKEYTNSVEAAFRNGKLPQNEKQKNYWLKQANLISSEGGLRIQKRRLNTQIKDEKNIQNMKNRKNAAATKIQAMVKGKQARNSTKNAGKDILKKHILSVNTLAAQTIPGFSGKRVEDPNYEKGWLKRVNEEGNTPASRATLRRMFNNKYELRKTLIKHRGTNVQQGYGPLQLRGLLRGVMNPFNGQNSSTKGTNKNKAKLNVKRIKKEINQATSEYAKKVMAKQNRNLKKAAKKSDKPQWKP